MYIRSVIKVDYTWNKIRHFNKVHHENSLLAVHTLTILHPRYKKWRQLTGKHFFQTFRKMWNNRLCTRCQHTLPAEEPFLGIVLFLCLSRNDKSWGISDVHANGDPIDDPGQKNGLSETISLWYKMMTCSSLPHSISSVKHSIFKYGHNLLPNISVIVWSRDEWCSVPISYRWLKSNITTSFGWLSRNFLMSSKHGITSAPYRPWIKHTLPDELSLDMRMSKYRIPEFSCCSAVKFCVIDQRYMTSRPGAPNMWTTAWISLDWSGATWECGSRL